MTDRQIARLCRRFGFTRAHARLVAALHYGEARK